MPELMLPKGSFSSKIPGLQTVWDSTSLGVLKECPKKYDLSIRHDWQSKSPNVHLKFGIAAHGAREAYYRAIASGAEHQEAQRVAVEWAAKSTGSVVNGSWQPWVSADDRKDLYHLILFTVWYTEYYKHDQLQTLILSNGQPAVELSFKLPTGIQAPDGEEYFLSGHLDRVVVWEDALWISDLKTSKSSLGRDYFNQYAPDNQMSLYSLAGHMVLNLPIEGIILDAVQILADGCTFARGFIKRSRNALEEWFFDFRTWLVLNESFVQTGHYPRNDKSCNHYSGCQFRDYCNASQYMRPNLLETYFTKVPWDPTKNRGGE